MYQRLLNKIEAGLHEIQDMNYEAGNPNWNFKVYVYADEWKPIVVLEKQIEGRFKEFHVIGWGAVKQLRQFLQKVERIEKYAKKRP